MLRRCRHAAHDHPWAVVALDEGQRCADELLGKHRARPAAIHVSAGGPPAVQIRAARGRATACMWPCGPARAFRQGARPVHGATRPPTAGRAQDRPDPPQIRPAGAQTRWPCLGSSAATRGTGWASARPRCTAAMAAGGRRRPRRCPARPVRGTAARSPGRATSRPGCGLLPSAGRPRQQLPMPPRRPAPYLLPAPGGAGRP